MGHAVLRRCVAQRAAAGLPPIAVGVAVTTGRVIFGAIGDESRLEFTVIGDAVNLAAKLDKHSKAEGVRALTTAEAYDLALAQGFATARPLERRPARKVEGVTAPVDLAVIAEVGAMPPFDESRTTKTPRHQEGIEPRRARRTRRSTICAPLRRAISFLCVLRALRGSTRLCFLVPWCLGGVTVPSTAASSGSGAPTAPVSPAGGGSAPSRPARTSRCGRRARRRRA